MNEWTFHNKLVNFPRLYWCTLAIKQNFFRAEDIVNLDLKSTLRVLYNLFTKYKHLS